MHALPCLTRRTSASLSRRCIEVKLKLSVKFFRRSTRPENQHVTQSLNFLQFHSASNHSAESIATLRFYWSLLTLCPHSASHCQWTWTWNLDLSRESSGAGWWSTEVSVKNSSWLVCEEKIFATVSRCAEDDFLLFLFRFDDKHKILLISSSNSNKFLLLCAAFSRNLMRLFSCRWLGLFLLDGHKHDHHQ